MIYEIDINIDNQGLDQIYSAGQMVTLARGMIIEPASATAIIAWVSFPPLMENMITWEDNYFLYATTTALTPGAVIRMNSQTTDTAQPGWIYTLDYGMFTAQPGTGNAFNVVNKMSQYNFSFGLAQQYVMVNNVQTLSLLNATPIVYNAKGNFMLLPVISIFLSSYSQNSVISHIEGNALTVTLTGKEPTVSVGFNDSDNSFYLMKGENVREAGGSPARRFAQSLISSRR